MNNLNYNRKNFNLCKLNFSETPYCNQMGVIGKVHHRFCDVCGKRWEFTDEYIIETTRKDYRLSDLIVGTQWILFGFIGFKNTPIIKIIETGDIDEFGEDYVNITIETAEGKQYSYILKDIKSNIKPIVRKITEDDIKNLT